VAYGPWPKRADLAQETQDKLRFVTRNLDPVSARRQINLYRQQDRLCPQAEQEARRRGWKAFQASEVTPRDVDRAPHNDERLDALVPPGPGAMVHAGAPALTVENVRGVYSQQPAVAPLPIRQQIAFIGQETLRHRAMARALGAWCEVNWVVPQAGDGVALRRLCEAADLVITTAEQVQRFPFLRNGHRPIVVDTQPPLIPGAHVKGAHRGALHKQAETCPELSPRWLDNVDHLICASEEERLYWLGQLAARGRVNRYTWQNDPALRNLVTVVPSGFETPMPPSEPVLKGIHPDIHADDQVILWCGGLQSYDDPLTAIRALAELQPACGDAKLVFAALNDQAWNEELLASAGQLATELGLEHAVLFVGDVPRHLRAGYLAEADLGIALGMDSLEAQISPPVGLAACMAAGPPLVTTLGRAGSSLVVRYELGYCVPAGDIGAVVHAMIRSLETPRALYRDRFARAGAALAWSKNIAPLIRFCRRPQLALDRQVELLLHSEPVPTAPQPTPLGELPAKFWHTLRYQGIRSTSQEVLQYIRWKMRR
jgi:glycosyltransferase involved in cell wall biosynthesis